jgi:hypothetical protein
MAARDDILPARYADPELVAHGGMGEIYRATDRTLDRDVAIKLLAGRFAHDEPLRSRFTREALAAARLSGDPHAVTIFDVGEHGGRAFIVMEYLAGGSLESRLREGPVPAGQALEWLEHAARTLDAAHARGIVHRDVKPANLLFDANGAIKVADFGIASAAGLDSTTKPGTVLGTAGYLSPEQARGERARPASDLYALAVVAYELLTGERPFARAPPPAEAMAHVNDPVPSVCGRRTDLPCELDPVFERALAKDPAARHASCAELVADLRAALAAAAGRTVAMPAAIPPPAHARASRLPVALAALAVLAAGGGALGWTLTRGGGDGSAASVPRTVVHTVTTQAAGTTVQQTVTQTVAQPSETVAQPSESSPAAGASGTALNDAGYARMQAGDYAAALPLFEQAVARLQGTGSTGEAYADYNLAFTRYALGRCDGVLALLDRSEAIQGERDEIRSLRSQARKTCA